MFTQSMLRKLIIALVLISLAIFIYLYSNVFMPILLALLTAIMFEPLVKWFQKLLKTEKRLLPVTLFFTIFLVSISIAIYVATIHLINQLMTWFYQLPRYVAHIQLFAMEKMDDLHEFLKDMPYNHLIMLEIERQTQGLTEKAYDAAQQGILLVSKWIQAIPNLIVLTLVFLIALFLFSLDLPRIANLFYSMFKEETEEKLRYVFERLGKVFLGYWKAQFLLSILIFVLTYLALLYMAPEHALLMSVIIWFIDIIPLYVGPALILVPWAIFAFIMGNNELGIQLLVFATLLLILRRSIEPKVLGDHMGLSALATVLSMYFGFYFFGVIGLIFGPFAVIALRSAREAGLFNMNIKI